MFQFGVGDEDKDLIAVFVVSNDEDESAQMECSAWDFYLASIAL